MSWKNVDDTLVKIEDELDAMVKDLEDDTENDASISSNLEIPVDEKEGSEAKDEVANLSKDSEESRRRRISLASLGALEQR